MRLGGIDNLTELVLLLLVLLVNHAHDRIIYVYRVSACVFIYTRAGPDLLQAGPLFRKNVGSPNI